MKIMSKKYDKSKWRALPYLARGALLCCNIATAWLLLNGLAHLVGGFNNYISISFFLLKKFVL